jgi:hypothetical protein
VLACLLAAPNLAQAQSVQNGPTQQQLQQAGGKVIIAALAHAAARDLAQQPNAGPRDAFAEQIALAVRNAAIDSALGDLFPRLNTHRRRDIRLLISDAIDGRLNLFNQHQQKAKQRLIKDLRTIDPNLAEAAALAEFIYGVHQAFQMQYHPGQR